MTSSVPWQAAVALIATALTCASLSYAMARPIPLPGWGPRLRPAPLFLATLRLAVRTISRQPLPAGSRRALEFTVALACAGLAGFAVRGLHNSLLFLTASAVGALSPAVLRNWLAARRRRRVAEVLESFLDHLTHIAAVRSQPLPALSDALEGARPPLRQALAAALTAARSGTPLPDALHRAATRLGGNFYLHQIAYLTGLSQREGAPFAEGLQRLLERHRLLEEVQAEERAEMHGYRLFTASLALLVLAPIPFWAATGSPHLLPFVTDAIPRLILSWSVLSSLAVAALPWLLALDVD